MFNQFEPNVKATISFLKRLGIKVNNATVNETLQNHPDWPTLLCISDSLNKWNIINGAGKIDPAHIDQLPVPFIAYTNDRKVPLAIVNEVSKTSIEISQKNYNKTSTENRENFLQKWSGVYLIAEPNEHSGEPNYEAHKQKAFLNSLTPVTVFTLLTILSFLFLIGIVGKTAAPQTVNAAGVYLQYFILLAGVAVTTLLLWYEIDKNNPLLQKVCTGIAKGNCNAILSGKQAKVFSWLSWSEVGFFYFIGNLLTLLFAENTITNSIGVIAWLNILALPYTVFSIYYQWRVAKQWCILCLAVQALLLLGGMNVIANNFLYPIPHFSSALILKCMLLYILPVLLWYAIKPYILRLQEAKNTKREYLRIKFNAEIFDTLLKKQKTITVPADGLGIDLGNPAATNTLIKICNPYCGPCAKVHPVIDDILHSNLNVKVKVIFTATTKEKDDRNKPVKHLLSIADEGNELKIEQALDDWYLAEKKDYELFAKKYPLNGELLKQANRIEAMDKWCNAMEISFTPTIFLNGYQLPDAYSIEDLKYFLLE